MDRIERDVDKLDRRLGHIDDVYLTIRVNEKDTETDTGVTMELEYRRNHITATAEAADMFQAIRFARDEVLRQVNDRQRTGHSDYSKNA